VSHTLFPTFGPSTYRGVLVVLVVEDSVLLWVEEVSVELVPVSVADCVVVPDTLVVQVVEVTIVEVEVAVAVVHEHRHSSTAAASWQLAKAHQEGSQELLVKVVRLEVVVHEVAVAQEQRHSARAAPSHKTNGHHAGSQVVVEVTEVDT